MKRLVWYAWPIALSILAVALSIGLFYAAGDPLFLSWAVWVVALVWIVAFVVHLYRRGVPVRVVKD